MSLSNPLDAESRAPTSPDSFGPSAAANSSGRSIARAAGLITLGSLLSRILGLARESIIALLFGTTVDTSAFRTAATVPTMLYDLVIGGAVSAALIPVFSEQAARDEARGDRRSTELGQVAGTIAFGALLTTGLAVVFLALVAPQLVTMLGVDEASGARDRTIELVRVILPSVVFLGLSGVVTAVLYARQSFAFPAFAIACYNLGIIAGGILLAPVLGVTGLVVGVLLGAFGQMGLQFVGLMRSGIRLGINFRHPAVLQAVRLYVPVAFGIVVSQLGIIVDRNLAWRIGPDSVAIMSFATTLVQLPLGLVATATSFAVLPALSRLSVSRDGLAGFRRTLESGLRLAFLAIVPAMVALVILREPVVRLLFERGAFDADGTAATATALLFYAPQLPFVAIDQLLIFAFYARKNTLTPALVGLFGVGVYLLFGIGLSGPAGMGLNGLVLANTLQNSLHALVLYWLLYREVGTLLTRGTWGLLATALLAAVPLTAACAFASTQISPGSSSIVTLVGLAAAGSVGLALYAGVLLMRRVPEAEAITEMIRRRLGR